MASTFTVYEVLGHRDLEEGRGGYTVRATLVTLGHALELVRDTEFIGRHGLWGRPDFRINEVAHVAQASGNTTVTSTLIWGSRRGTDGTYRNGFIDLRDDQGVDPEYAEYVRLAHKFGKAL